MIFVFLIYTDSSPHSFHSHTDQPLLYTLNDLLLVKVPLTTSVLWMSQSFTYFISVFWKVSWILFQNKKKFKLWLSTVCGCHSGKLLFVCCPLFNFLCCFWFWAGLMAHFIILCMFVMKKEEKTEYPLFSSREIPPNMPLETPPSPPEGEDEGEAEVEGHYGSLKKMSPVPAELWMIAGHPHRPPHPPPAHMIDWCWQLLIKQKNSNLSVNELKQTQFCQWSY